MLPSAARLTKSQEFRLVVRRGRRAGRTRLVVHALRPDSPSWGAGHQEAGHGPSSAAHHGSVQPQTAPTRQSRVGFVVSKAVGVAVVRHRVARRLRHLMWSRLAHLPAGTLVVVRALPPAAQAPSTELGADIDAALRKLRLLDGRSADSRDDDSGIRHGKLGRGGQ